MSHQTIGTNASRIDAPGKVTGKTLYPGDITHPDMLHMATLFGDRPHARILSIDTTAAEAAPGVVAVFTAKDVPVNLYGLQIKDQPVLCGPGSDKPGADVVRCVGDQIALVVAETEAQARAACKLIRIEWEDLPLVLDPEAAAPSLAGGLVAADPTRPVPYQLHPHCPDNVCYGYRIRKGDIEAGFREADVIIEGVYQTPVQEHAYLQPEAGVAYLDEEGRITVEVAGQWTHEDQGQIAHALGIPKEQVRVIYPAIGGAFGGREDMSVQITLALAVWRLAQRGVLRGRAVKTIWSREESMVGHGKRHTMKIYTRWGAKRDGKLTAVQVKVIADGGAYMYTSNKVLGNTTLTCTGPYDIPHVAVDTHAVYTNHVPGAAFRGFGGPQGHFAAESQMDKLAEALDIDPVELRLRNIITDQTILSVGTPIPGGVGMTETIITAAKAAGWTQDEAGQWRRPMTDDERRQDERRRGTRSSVSSILRPIPIRRGIGFAAGFKNVGFCFGYQENSYARIEARGGAAIEEATLFFAGADCGQGNHTIIAQIAAEVLSLPVERIKVIASDTSLMANAGSASASRLTYMSGNAVKGAAERRRSPPGRTKIALRWASSPIWRQRPPSSTRRPARASRTSPMAMSRRWPWSPWIPRPAR